MKRNETSSVRYRRRRYRDVGRRLCHRTLRDFTEDQVEIYKGA